MSPDLTSLQPYPWAKYAAEGMTDEPDHTMVPLGDYDFDWKPNRTQGTVLFEGLMYRMYGSSKLKADEN